MSRGLRVPLSPGSRATAFSLVEMLATVAALVIVLGLAVSLARYVRHQASDRLTKDLLAQLDELVRRYEDRYKALPAVPAFVSAGAAGGAGEGETAPTGDRKPVGDVSESPRPPSPPSPLRSYPETRPDDTLPPEPELQRSAHLNNRAFVQTLRVEARRYPTEFRNLPPSFEAEGTLHDAWGTPVVFMPSMHPAVGMAMADDPFFLSAGPDRQFHTSEDNLFSYEEGER